MTIIDQLSAAPRRLDSWARDQARAYREDTDQDRPLAGYAGAMTAYGAAVAGLVALARRTGRTGPGTVTPWDVLLLGAATHKVSRLIAKDAVTSPLRAPFVRYQGTVGDAELTEEVRSHGGAKHTVGELITCPFCLAQWVATGFVAGWVFVPTFTRLTAAAMAGVTVSDYLQLGYAALQDLAEG